MAITGNVFLSFRQERSMRKVREGKALLSVPVQPMTRKAEAFYNPDMEYQRDLTLSALRVFHKKSRRKLSACDPLAGTGVRSVRMALEVPGIGRIVANDLNPLAVKVMRKNFRGNGVRAEVRNMNANDLFLDNPRGFDFIDIDPFGSHISYVFNAGYALKKRSMLGCTATDTGALCGAFPSTCFSRYGISSYKTDFYREVGVRVLITSTMLELSKHDMVFEPLYCHADHYFRVIGMVRKSKSALTRQSRKMTFLTYCGHCLYRSFEIRRKCPGCGKNMQFMGPLWVGNIRDRQFCTSVLRDLQSKGYKKTKELKLAISEIDEPFYYDLHRLFRVRRASPKRMDDILNGLDEAGFMASRTHLSGTGIKTDAPYDRLISLL
jgi:tRNA (guanine26-N2/guanine27-N2)-dimethyltransferase